ncbi:MAG: hypothetical protein HY565_03940 [Candidatus Kerfeldbacteria bacterium]|nr:hypothetical protein [Candidatus Kerfeldbacteria bacterium]
MKKFLAGFLAFIILVAFPIVLLSTITIYWVFTPGTIKKIIHASEIGENLPGLILALAADQAENSAEFDITATAEFVGTTFSAEDVYGLTDPLVDGVGSWFGTDKPIEQLDLTVNITNLKTKLAPAIAEQINSSGMELPTCDFNMFEFDTGAFDDSGIPADFNCPTDSAGFTDELMKNIPDTVNVQDLLQEQLVKNGGASQLALVNQQVDMFRTYWGALHWIVWIGWAMIGFCFLLIILLRLHPGYAPFGWLAWLKLLQILELLPVTLMVWLAPRFILPWISGSFDSVIVAVINKASSALLATYLWPLIWVVAGLLTSTIVWFIIRAIVKHHITGKNQPPQSAPPAQPVAPVATAK